MTSNPNRSVAEALADPVEQREVDRIAEGVGEGVLGDDADDAGAPPAQRPSERVGPGVVEFGSGGEHALARGCRDRARAAEHERRGRPRDAGARRDGRECRLEVCVAGHGRIA